MDETIELFHRVLSVIGIPIFAKRNFNSKLWLIRQMFNLIIGVLCFIFSTGCIIISYDDLLVFIEGACTWTTSVIMNIILSICLIFRYKFREFLEEMAFQDCVFEIPFIKHILKQQEGEKIIKLKNLVLDSQENFLKNTRLLLRIYVSIVFLVATSYLSSALYELFTSDDDSVRPLAFQMWFPWSLDNIYVYIGSFIYHAYAGFLCCLTYSGFQCTIMLLVGQNIRQLKILTFILLNLDELVTELVQGKTMYWQPYCTSVLSQCVQHYIKIKSFSNRLNVICRPFYLTLIMIAIFVMCMCSVRVAMSKKLDLYKVTYYGHASAFVMVVLMFCLMGQALDNQCEKLELAITEKWYIFDKRHKMNILIFKTALSQRMPIYIFGTTTLSLPTFTWVIKTVMSFFTLFMSVLEDA